MFGRVQRSMLYISGETNMHTIDILSRDVYDLLYDLEITDFAPGMMNPQPLNDIEEHLTPFFNDLKGRR